MDEISSLNTPVFSGDRNSAARVGLYTCLCCLSTNVPLVKLANCKHVEFFVCNFDFKLEYTDTVVCYACHSTLKNIYQFKRQVEISVSNLNKQNNGGTTCAICKSVLNSTASFKEHMRRHYRRVDCGVCGARYNTVTSAQCHYDKVHATSKQNYKCQECGFATSSYRRLRYHRDSHKGKVNCDQCGKSFVNSSGLKVHVYTVHKRSDRIYSCAECPKSYRQSSGLLSHMESAHGARGGAYCVPCRTHFQTEHNLKHHLNTHSKHTNEADKKHVCSVCDARFIMKGQLKEHVEWEHLKNTKHKCGECDKMFKSAVKLKRHQNYVHEKKRPPRNKMCDHCGRGFTTMNILRSHIRTHTGERPHVCSHCPATFAHSAALYTHNKLLHTQKTTSA